MATVAKAEGLTQKAFRELLRARAAKYGFQLRDHRIREKRTGNCPVVAVAVGLGKRKLNQVRAYAAARSIGLCESYAGRVAKAADYPEYDPKLRRTILKLVGLSEKN